MAERAAALFEALIVTQPFADGNKRTAWLAVRVLLGLNGWTVRHTPEEVERLGRSVASRHLGVGELRAWFDARIEPLGRGDSP